MTRVVASIRRGFYLFAGILLVLYSLSLIVLGMEDVGGPKVAIPAAIVLAGLGVLLVRFGLGRVRVEEGCPDQDDQARNPGGDR
jgi:quinol-cytochrome oxidoreductase complex cytochrome b subunit